MRCPSGHDNPAGQKYCGECGAVLEPVTNEDGDSAPDPEGVDDPTALQRAHIRKASSWARWLILGVAVAVAGAAAVSALLTSRDDGDEPATAEGLEVAARDAAEAVVNSDVMGAYRRFARECRDQVSLSDFAGQLFFANAFAEGFVGDLDTLQIDQVETRNVADGHGEARIVASFFDAPEVLLDGGEAEWEEWVYEDGMWRSTVCPEPMEGLLSEDGFSLGPPCDEMFVNGQPVTLGDEESPTCMQHVDGDDQLVLSIRFSCESGRGLWSNDLGWWYEGEEFHAGDGQPSITEC